MIKKIMIAMVSVLFVCSTSCQAKEKQASNIKTENMIDLDSLLATYTTKPMYYIRYGNMDCLFDIRINDNYTVKITNKATMGTATPINTKILQSGKNKVTVRLYPDPGEMVIPPSNPDFPDRFYLEVGVKDFSLSKDGEGMPTWFLTMPYVEIPEGGLPYYEWEAEFEADVPYTTTGWSDCIDLRHVPDIEKRVVERFKEIRQLYVNKEIDKIEELTRYKRYDIAVPLYWSNKEFNEEWLDDKKDILRLDAAYWQEIEDYELVFYADGRLVTLESKKRSGYPGALLHLKQEEDGMHYFVFEMRLGIRKGTDELIPIR